MDDLLGASKSTVNRLDIVTLGRGKPRLRITFNDSFF